MPPIPRLPVTVTSTAVPLVLTVAGAFLLRRLLGTAISVVAMLTVGRLLLTALKIDLALAERRTTRAARGGRLSALRGEPLRVQQADQEQADRAAHQLRGNETGRRSG